jgi:AcrR family transcriptional regulator
MRKKAPKTDYHHGDLRRALIAAAVELIDQAGPEALTLRAVARRVGVSHTACYRHFGDKRALLVSVAELGFRSMDALAEDHMARAPASALRKLEAYGVAYVSYGLAQPSHFRVMFGHEIEKGSGAFPELDAAAAACLQRLVDVISGGQRDGVFRGSDPGVVARASWSLVHGLTCLLLESLTPMGADLEATVRDTIRVAMTGIVTARRGSQ